MHFDPEGTLGEKIIAMRRSKGISQELLAENSRVSLRTIQRIERGASVPRPYTVKVIADALGIPVEDLNAPSPHVDAGTTESLSRLKQINLSGLSVLILPFGNVFLPLLLWRKYRGLPLIQDSGSRVISFQLLWTVATLLILACTQSVLMGMDYSNVIGKFPPTILMVYMFMLLMNVVSILRAALVLHSGNHRIYSSVPKLI